MLKSESRPAGLNDRWLVPGVCIFLAAIVWLVFGQTLGHEFVNYDDNLYVYENPAVAHGLSLEGVEWAFTHTVVANWHPLTMMSHMLDCQFYGLNAGGHHLTNVLLHTASVILLFLLLRQMMGLRPEKSVGATIPQAGLHPDKGGATAPQAGVLWRSAFVAAVFAIHPLRVESVAWVAERKDVLSGLFFMLTLWAYARYVASDKWQVTRTESTPSPATRHASLFYGLVLLFFALGLMSKPMLVTLPFVLLLLDYWPLNRFAPPTPFQAIPGNGDSSKNHSIPWRLIVEKVPLLALTGAACVATMVAQKDIIAPVPLVLRIGNAVVSYVVYLRQMVCPADLAVLYPYPQNGLPGWEITLAVVLLAAISAGVILRRQKEPYLLIGWLWYLGMLVPAIGLVQSGLRAYADRYTYLPQIGLYLMLTWGAAELCAGWRYRRVMLGGGATVILVALIFCARAQTAHWRNNELLWTHTLACTSGNYVAHNNLGNVLFQKGKVDEAIAHFQKALQCNPDYAEACYNLGNALLQKGDVDEAMVHYQKALQIKPDYAEAHLNLGMALLQKGNVDDAIVHYQTALQINPNYAEACYNLGNALLQKGRVDEAIAQYQKALQITPDNTKAHNNLGSALFQKGSVDEAIAHYQTALQIRPDYAAAHNNLGIALFQKGKVDEAITHYQTALQINPDYAAAHNNLGMTLFQKGKVGEAITHYQTALQINPDYAEAHNNLGNALLKQGRVDEAITHYQKTLQINPDYVEAHNNLGNTLLKQGRVDEAITHYQKALQIKPDSAVIRNNLGNALVQKGKVDEAITHYQTALQINPDYAEAHNNLGNALFKQGRVDEAITHYQKTLQIKPDSVGLLNNLAWLLATCPDAHVRDGVQAVKYAGRACELTHYGVTILVGTLAAAYAEAERYDDAIVTAQKACVLATAAGEQDLLEKNQKLLALYRAHQPYHEPAGKVVPAAP